MKEYLVFDRDVIEPGMMLVVRSYSRLGKMIRWALNKWLKRLCKKYHLEFKEAWSNHSAEFVSVISQEELGIGEALAPGGNVVSTLGSYEWAMNAGRIEVKVVRVKGISKHDQTWASANWNTDVKGRPYDYMGYPRLLFKSLFFDWSDVKPTNKIKQLMKWIGDSAAGREWADWCTEGVGISYRKKPSPGMDIFQTKNPTPLTQDQCLGLCPAKPGKKITLEEVPGAIKKIKI